ncbi:MAG TPA: hypothetical protein VLL72_09325, partial [Kiloniellales bacterium]|nr:hypothetical protein [Kiloniellales bacterium]
MAACLWLLGAAGPSQAQPGPREVVGLGVNGTGKTWSLSAERAFLAVPYVGDDLGGAVASVEVGEALGVALFQRPFFASRDLGCAPEIGSDDRLDLLWRGATARFEPGPAGRGEDSAALPDPETGGYASLILYRKDLGPPPGVLIMDRRRTIGSKCRSVLHKTAFNRIFVPVSDAPGGSRCFDLVGRHPAGEGKELSLDFDAADSAVLLSPALYDPSYGRGHSFTATLYSQPSCGGSAMNLESAAPTPKTRLSEFGFRDLVRSVLVRYQAGPLLAYLPAPEASVPGTPVATRAPQQTDSPALQELERRTATAGRTAPVGPAKSPETPEPQMPPEPVAAEPASSPEPSARAAAEANGPAPETAPWPARDSVPEPAPVQAVEASPATTAAGPQPPAAAPEKPASRPGEVQQALPKLTPEVVPSPSSA